MGLTAVTVRVIHRHGLVRKGQAVWRSGDPLPFTSPVTCWTYRHWDLVSLRVTQSMGSVHLWPHLVATLDITPARSLARASRLAAGLEP